VRDEEAGPLTVSLRTDSCQDGEEVLCTQFTGDRLEVALLEGLTAGTYFLIAESATTEEFTLRLLPATKPSNDGCADATRLDFGTPPDSVVDVAGELLFAADDLDGEECGRDGAPELAYRFQLAESRALVFARPPQVGDLAFWIATPPCDEEARQLVCGELPAQELSLLRTRELPAGEYLLAIEGERGSSFELSIVPTIPIPGDSCVRPLPLLFDAQGQATVQGDTGAAANDLDARPCAAGRGPDLVYSFELSATARFSATTDAAWDTLLALRADPCDDQDGNIDCDDDSGAGTNSLVSVAALPAGVYYLIVDGYYEDNLGEFTLSATVSPAEAVVRP